ncbi:carbohydrate ABC transporter permease [Paenibacillus aurantius]|uniref:Carbohydrate ABC transporter permease n=1 Tax=Paenibacillus aurantius TaxID=2918900 RepID=A0AA96LMP2_9BACL|nr:carbohydrate ABC transporter permease [Paenibacillus aurantius]WNQ13997.1 carbohydrate ABC transporter permease [Paenibacillus aurantius]
MKTNIAGRLGHSVNYLLLTAIAAVTLFPFLYVLSVSFTPESEVLRRVIVLIPEKITLSAYHTVFAGLGLGQAYKITLFRTLVGTALNLLFTAIPAYVLSKKALPGRSGLLLFIVFTMLFNGGLIPTYILIKSLGLMNSIWSLIIPGLISVFNLIVMKTFFEQLPPELEESARVDGSGELTTLWKIILPLSLPSFATIGLFYAVSHWNSYFDAVMYINNPQLMPLQVVLRNILLSVQNQSAEQSALDGPVSTFAIQMAAVIVSTVPILCVYPFIQKHFAKGVLVGSVKG